MASFLVMVHSDNYANQSSYSALKFAEAVVAQGHQLKAVFFYQQGVHHANHHCDIPSDELNSQNGFIALHQQHDIPLLLCVTAAEKRGIPEVRPDAAFTVAGLAEMAAIAADCDRMVQFK